MLNNSDIIQDLENIRDSVARLQHYFEDYVPSHVLGHFLDFCWDIKTDIDRLIDSLD